MPTTLSPKDAGIWMNGVAALDLEAANSHAARSPYINHVLGLGFIFKDISYHVCRVYLLCFALTIASSHEARLGWLFPPEIYVVKQCICEGICEG